MSARVVLSWDNGPKVTRVYPTAEAAQAAADRARGMLVHPSAVKALSGHTVPDRIFVEIDGEQERRPNPVRRDLVEEGQRLLAAQQARQEGPQ